MSRSSTVNSSGGADQVCCLFDKGKKCKRLAGNASYNRRIQKLVFKHNLGLQIDQAQCNHLYICDHHKNVIQDSAKHKSEKVKKSEQKANGRDHSASSSLITSASTPSAAIGANLDHGVSTVEPAAFDWTKMPLTVLRRYRAHFKLPSQPGISKADLAQIVGEHFRSWKVSEKEVITYFVYMLKTNKNRLDQAPNADDKT